MQNSSGGGGGRRRSSSIISIGRYDMLQPHGQPVSAYVQMPFIGFFGNILA